MQPCSGLVELIGLCLKSRGKFFHVDRLTSTNTIKLHGIGKKEKRKDRLLQRVLWILPLMNSQMGDWATLIQIKFEYRTLLL